MGSWGQGGVVPDLGQMLHRDRVAGLIGRSGDKPCIVFGASGCGKSVAAAQFALASGRSVVWIDAAGEFVSGSELGLALVRASGKTTQSAREARRSDCSALADVVDAAMRCIRSREGTEERILLVAEDLGPPPDLEGALGIRTLARSLQSVESRVLITCRSLSDWPSDFLKECALIGPDDLALTSEEAEAYLRHVGLASLVGKSEELRDACGGHAAFFALLASQAARHGLAAQVARTPSLEAWLGSAIRGLTDSNAKRALLAVTMMHTGNDGDLRALKVSDPIATLDALASTIPLLGFVRNGDGGCTFSAHELLDGYLADVRSDSGLHTDTSLVSQVVGLLSQRADYGRAAELLSRENNLDEAAQWLIDYSEQALAEGHHAALGRLIECVPIAAMMAKPLLLLTWAEVCAQSGQIEDALAKCRAAKAIAEHTRDTEVIYRTLALCARFADRANKAAEAEEFAAEILAAPRGLVDGAIVAEAMLCRAHAAAARCEYDAAEEMFRTAIEAAGSSADAANMTRSAHQALAMMPALARGDYFSASRLLAPSIVEIQKYCLTDRVMAKGNVAACLCEVGRLSRSERLLESALSESQSAGLDEYSGAYMGVMGCVQIGLGHLALGTGLLRDAIALSLSGGDETGADQNRLYLAMALRASGDLAESLMVAERVFERLTIADAYGSRRLAALEVAASLLAMGDSSVGSEWVDAVEREGFGGNLSHSFRAAMIRAEMDCVERRRDDAVARISRESQYLLSENANWQAAVYCRTFPRLLGVMAAAVGPKMLPAHLFRMIPADDAKRVLREADSFLEATQWRTLGDRLLGESEMDRILASGDTPLCRVRVFGGLEVTVGDRVIRDRDWKKRKARTLFCMLATKRGQDTPREQVIEHLWPDMDAERAKNNLYVAWSTMKSVLGGSGGKGLPSPYVESVGGVCRIVRDTVILDIDEFEAALSTVRAAGEDAGREGLLAAYERIADLYRGELLPGDVYDDWFAGVRERYRSEYVDAMVNASQLSMDAGEPGKALAYLRRAIQTDSLREDLYQHALRCQIATGQRSAAIETYLQCRGKLSEELGLDPSAETRALYDRILSMEDGPTSIPFDPARTWFSW